MTSPDDLRFMRHALALAERGLGRTWPNPSVGCVIVKDGGVVGRGVTQPGGRPHAEAMALAQAGAAAAGATIYVTLEPCAHTSPRGPACSDLLVAAQPARVVMAWQDPDPRTAGDGVLRLQQAGIETTVGVLVDQAREQNLGFVLRLSQSRPMVTLKLALSLDGRVAFVDPAGTAHSRWITGPEARAHAHLERARHDAILIGRGTFAADDPSLDVRLPGLEAQSPLPIVWARSGVALKPGWRQADHDTALGLLTWAADEGITRLMVEGGPQVAATLLADDLVDRLLLYRAPVVLGAGPALASDIGLDSLSNAHGRWQHRDSRVLGVDRLDVYMRHRV
jgi:diaminohydroxyphosphoribosylaminopyrimidine deaminase/5-amino-6-(5-phosphoribosylamino)uracil reductase